MRALLLIFVSLFYFFLVVNTELSSNLFKNNIFFQYLKIDPSFVRLPNHSQIEDMIISGDSFALFKLVKEIDSAKEFLSCEELTYYSNEVLGMMQIAKKKKEITLAQLRYVFREATKTIEKLNAENTNLKQEIENLGVFDKKNELENNINSLKRYYSESQTSKTLINPKNYEIRAIEGEIKTLTSYKRQQREKMNNHRILLAQVNKKIDKLQKQMMHLQNQKRKVEEKIQKSSQKILQLQNQINNSYLNIVFIETQIEQIQGKVDFLEKTIIKHEVSIQRQRINVAQVIKDQQFKRHKIQANNREISLKKNQINQRIEKFFISLLNTLAKYKVEYKTQNKQLYYDCYGMNNTELVLENDGKYIIEGNSLPYYLENLYGSDISLPSYSFDLTTQFKRVDLFCNKTPHAEGYPFSTQFLKSDSLFMEGSFTCLSLANIRSYNGILQKMNNNSLEIKIPYGKTITAYLSQCSRLEMSSIDLQLGRTIYFRGEQLSQTQINLYIGTII